MVLLTVIAPNSLIHQYLAYCFNTAWGEGGAKHHSSLSKQNIRWVVIKLLGSICSPTAFWKASGIDITLAKWGKKKKKISQLLTNIYGQLGQHRKYTIVSDCMAFWKGVIFSLCPQHPNSSVLPINIQLGGSISMWSSCTSCCLHL